MKKLSKLGKELADEFELYHSNRCCSCHINPPRGYCTHPGNPLNLAETPEAWEDSEPTTNQIKSNFDYLYKF